MEPWQEPRHGRGWLILLLGIAVFAAFGAVVGYAYFKGLPGIGGEPPLIKAEAGPYRSAPGDRGGLAVPNTNSSIVELLRPQSEPPRVERILPPEATPALESAEPEVEIEPTPEQPVAALVSPEEEPAVAAVPYPYSKPALPEPNAAPPAEPATISALPQIEPSARPVEPVTVLEPEVAPPPSPPPAPEPQIAEPVPAPAPPPPPPAPAPAPQRLVRAEPTAPAPPAPASPTTGAGIYRLQLAAVRSEGGLTQAWADLRQRYPTALASVNPQVERTDTTSGPLFRLQAGPFTSREAAANACGSIRGSGGQCFIVGPIGQ